MLLTQNVSYGNVQTQRDNGTDGQLQEGSYYKVDASKSDAEDLSPLLYQVDPKNLEQAYDNPGLSSGSALGDRVQTKEEGGVQPHKEVKSVKSTGLVSSQGLVVERIQLSEILNHDSALDSLGPGGNALPANGYSNNPLDGVDPFFKLRNKSMS